MDQLRTGTTLLKVNEKGTRDCVFRLDPDDATIRWDSRKHGIIPIESIKQLRTRSDARYDRQLLKIQEDQEDRWISIVYILNAEYRTLHFIAPTTELYNLWHDTLRTQMEMRQGLMSEESSVGRESAWEKKFWRAGDSDGDERIGFDELKRLCHRINVNAPEAELRNLFQQCDPEKKEYLDFEGYKQFVRLMKRRPDLETLYTQIAANCPLGQLDLSAFEAFIKDTQQSKLSSEQIAALFTKYTRFSESDATPETATDVQSTTMTLDQFSKFLSSTDNAVFTDHHGDIRHDMTRPISEYFISSSHNTYLVGHQLVGMSTVEGYIRALLHSCRSVEMDIYDGDDDYNNEPIIYHGKTLTTKVPLRDICQAIKKYGFTASPYPIIISAEVHCGLKQQEKLVIIMKEVFGGDLVQAPIEGRPPIRELPSPEVLKGKFLLKAKNLVVVAKAAADQLAAQKIAQAAESSSSSDSSSDEEDNNENGTPKKGGMMSSFKNKLRRAKEHVRSASGSHKHEHGEKQLMSFNLIGLIVYTVGVKCRGLTQDAGEYAPEHIFSLSESAANRMITGKGDGARRLIEHNRTHVSRIYPKGTRVNSTNYEPHRFWAVGSQLVAINWQTFDMGYMINLAMFKRNGHAGYLLKPRVLREANSPLLDMYSKHFFDVTVISAQQLPRPRDKSGHEIVDRTIVDPFVCVTLYIPDWSNSSSSPASSPSLGGTDPSGKAEYTPATTNTPAQPSTARTISLKTKAIRNNGFNPVWDEKLSVPFDVVGGLNEADGMKELIFVRFALYDDEDDEGDEPLGVYCTSLASLEMGYRYLPLHDSQMTPHLFSTLFVKIGVRDA